MDLPKRPPAPAAPVVVSRSTLIPGPKYSYERLTIENPSGRRYDRDIVNHPGAVVVVALLDPPDGRLVLIRNFRTAVEHAGAWVLECCAGTLDKPGEDPADCAARELIEETGYRAAAIRPLMPTASGSAGYFYTTPGLTSERMFPFIATGLTHTGQALEEGETIDVVLMTPAQVAAAIDGPRAPVSEGGSGGGNPPLIDAKSLVALTLATRRGFVRI